jgi:hypothetical protein
MAFKNSQLLSCAIELSDRVYEIKLIKAILIAAFDLSEYPDIALRNQDTTNKIDQFLFLLRTFEEKLDEQIEGIAEIAEKLRLLLTDR